MKNQQINFFIKVIGTTLKIFGGLSAIAQVVIFILEPEARLATFLALLVSLALFYLGRKQVLTPLLILAWQHRTASKVIIFASPIILTLFLIMLRVFLGHEHWQDMNTEGGFIEYGTSLAFLLAAIFAFPIGKSFLSRQDQLMGYLYYALAAGLFLVGMEEISWGQKLLGFKSSEFFQTYNSQSEITLHNLVWVNEYLDKGLMFVSLIAGSSWLFYNYLNKFVYNYRTKYLIPRWFFASFFLLVFGFFYLIEYLAIGNSSIANFQEALELIFSLGLLIFVTTNFLTIDN